MEIKPDLSPEFLHSVSLENGEKPAAIYRVFGGMVPAFALALLNHPNANVLLGHLGQTRCQEAQDWPTVSTDFTDMPALIWGSDLTAVSHAFAAFAAVKPSTVLALMPQVCTFWSCFLQERRTEKSNIATEAKSFFIKHNTDFQELIPASVTPYLGLVPAPVQSERIRFWARIAQLMRWPF